MPRCSLGVEAHASTVDADGHVYAHAAWDNAWGYADANATWPGAQAVASAARVGRISDV